MEAPEFTDRSAEITGLVARFASDREKQLSIEETVRLYTRLMLDDEDGVHLREVERLIDQVGDPELRKGYWIVHERFCKNFGIRYRNLLTPGEALGAAPTAGGGEPAGMEADAGAGG